MFLLNVCNVGRLYYNMDIRTIPTWPQLQHHKTTRNMSCRNWCGGEKPRGDQKENEVVLVKFKVWEARRNIQNSKTQNLKRIIKGKAQKQKKMKSNLHHRKHIFRITTVSCKFVENTQFFCEETNFMCIRFNTVPSPLRYWTWYSVNQNWKPWFLLSPNINYCSAICYWFNWFFFTTFFSLFNELQRTRH